MLTMLSETSREGNNVLKKLTKKLIKSETVYDQIHNCGLLFVYVSSNSVNVFLGLGLPWVLAAIYHESQGGIFKVESGALAFSVLVYSAVAFLALSLILLRRYLGVFGKSELGGAVGAKWASGIFLVFLWFVYITLSSLQAYDVIQFKL
jgi:hypothetical protein